MSLGPADQHSQCCRWALGSLELSSCGEGSDRGGHFGHCFLWVAERPAVDIKFSCDHRAGNSLGVGSEQPGDWFFLVCVCFRDVPGPDYFVFLQT